SSPVEIYKYDNNGNQLWHTTEDIEPKVGGYPHYEDLWQTGTDSDGNFYISASIISGLGPIEGGINFGMTKYNSNGTREWRHITDIFDRWDAPRGMIVNHNDIIYQNGNADGGCGMMRYDQGGTILSQDINTPATGFKYCWNSAVDPFNN
ncbi:unnamed protein product, partial [marine sediment metagenome]